MTLLKRSHWEKLRSMLLDAHAECVVSEDETYAQKIGIILDHMSDNEKFLLSFEEDR